MDASSFPVTFPPVLIWSSHVLTCVCDLALYAYKSIMVGILDVRHCLASMTDGSARIASGWMFWAETQEWNIGWVKQSISQRSDLCEIYKLIEFLSSGQSDIIRPHTHQHHQCTSFIEINSWIFIVSNLKNFLIFFALCGIQIRVVMKVDFNFRSGFFLKVTSGLLRNCHSFFAVVHVYFCTVL